MKLRRSRNEQETRPVERQGNAGNASDSVVAAGLLIDGDCTTPGALKIDGRVTGNVRARQLTVGPDGHIEGDVSGPDGGPAEGGAVIDGRVDGMVRAPRVEIGKSGVVGGGMQVLEAVIRGRVTGAVAARARLVLEESAVVEGDVTAPRLALREGGRVSGTIRIGEPKETASPKSETPTSAGGGGGPAGGSQSPRA